MNEVNAKMVVFDCPFGDAVADLLITVNFTTLWLVHELSDGGISMRVRVSQREGGKWEVNTYPAG